MGIADTLMRVKERICSSAAKAGRNADDIKLVAVSKRIDLDIIIEALHAGVTVLGENRIQEAKSKITELREKAPELRPDWHLIGHLQKNKAKTAVELFRLIHSVDSLGLAEEINNHAEKLGKVQEILIQVKLSDETAKHGVPEEDLMDVLAKVAGMDHLKLEGLMTMPPYFEDPEKTRPYFRKLGQLADSARERGFNINELSMGMSNDFEVAIEEGSTMVRVGTSIFGERAC